MTYTPITENQIKQFSNGIREKFILYDLTYSAVKTIASDFSLSEEKYNTYKLS